MDCSSNCSCYTVAVKRDFVAQHRLVGGDWGPENELHSHHYQVEVQLEGAELDRHGYLLDIVDIEQRLEGLITHFRDKTLNSLAEFHELNPSIEHFARILWDGMIAGGALPNLTALTVKIWENDIAWASFRRELK